MNKLPVIPIVIALVVILGGIFIYSNSFPDNSNRPIDVLDEMAESGHKSMNKNEPVAEPEPVDEPEQECPFGQVLIGDKCELTVLEGNIEIIMDNYKFKPAVIKIKKGSTITWRNEDTQLDGGGGGVGWHDVTSEDGLFKSTEMGFDAGFSHKFEQVGEFNYKCTPHPFMTGTIIVVD